jgi:MoxR-like ATPase
MGIQNITDKIIANIEKVIVGKRLAVELIVLGLLCEGHVLIEDVPGVGKTMLAKSLAKSINCSFSRIQCTPDMLPSDITGVDIYDQTSKKFKFMPGPILNQIILADEINRATQKTQSALLEAMQERQVTVGNTTHSLPEPFIVLATQNPIEYEGTFPLPEAQLDRFLIKVSIGYPDHEKEVEVIKEQQQTHPIDTISSVTTADEIRAVQEQVKDIFLADVVLQYIVEITQKTREADEIYLGSSPRGSLALARASQALAGMYGRDFVIPDDVKQLAGSTLGHRIILSSSARMKAVNSADLIQKIIEDVAVPGGDYQGD